MRRLESFLGGFEASSSSVRVLLLGDGICDVLCFSGVEAMMMQDDTLVFDVLLLGIE